MQLITAFLKASALIVFLCDVVSCRSSSSQSILSRRKRYLVFPEGASFSTAVCMTAVTVAPTTIFVESINWGIAYDLPNDTAMFREYKKYLKTTMQRRHRRDLYNKMEILMESMGYVGRPCIYRALCETARQFAPKQTSLVEEIIRIIFSFPLGNVQDNEPDDHRLYHWAFRRGREDTHLECVQMFPQCPFSLVDMALGYYSEFDDENANSNAISVT